MRPQPSRADDEGSLATVTEEVAQLRDLFQRRLLEDKAKNRLYEELYEQVALARGELGEQLLTPIFRDLILVIDRLTVLGRTDDVVVDSVVDELLEILARRDVRPVPSRSRFDVAIHEAVGTREGSGLPADDVVQVIRRGYQIGDKLLRAEQVVVASDEARQHQASEPKLADPGVDMVDSPHGETNH